MTDDKMKEFAKDFIESMFGDTSPLEVAEYFGDDISDDDAEKIANLVDDAVIGVKW